MVGAVGLARLALFAEAQLAIGLNGEGGGLRRCMGGERAVAVVVGGAAGRGEDGRGVAPVQQEVESDADKGRRGAWTGNQVSKKGWPPKNQNSPSHDTLEGAEQSETRTKAAQLVRP